MLYALIFIMIVMVYIFIRNPRSLYTIIFSLDFLSIFLLLFANVIYLIRIGNYQYMYQFEYVIYRMISKIPISYFNIKIILNIAFVLLITSTALLLESNIKNEKKVCIRKVLVGAVAILGSIAVLFLNSPFLTERLFIMQSASPDKWNAIRGQITAFNIGMMLFCFSPAVKLLCIMKKTNIILKQTHSKILLISRLIIYVIVLTLITLTPISNLIMKYDLYSFTLTSFDNKFIWIALLLAMGAILLIIFGKFDIFNEKLFNRNYKYKNTSIGTKDIRFVFHSYKNALFSIKLLSEKALETIGQEECVTTLKKINAQTISLSEQISDFLNIYNQVCLNYDNTNIVDCLDMALSGMCISDNIEVIKDYSEDDLIFFGDKNLISECIVNVISNACEAISQSGRKDGLIKIKTFSEMSYICISVIDNGIGIDKKIKNKVFAPLFSTKKSHQNWGIGLAYTKNILMAHMGDICFKSSPNQFTEFQITLPLETL